MSTAALPSDDGESVICLDIGGTVVRSAVVTAGARPAVRLRRRSPTHAEDGGAAVMEHALDLVAELRAEASEAVGVAVSSAGVIDPATGQVTSATGLMPGWEGVQIGRALEEAFGPGWTVLNDVHAHALGECRFGAGQDSTSTVVVAVGTGLGGAFIRGGELIRGAGGLAGHIGHMHHEAASGTRCTCGRWGHVESIASGRGILDRYEALRRPDERTARDAAEVAQLAATTRGTAAEVIAAAGFALGEVLGALANAWDPEQIILSGSVIGAGGLWWEALADGYRSSAMDPLADLPVLRGTLGDDAPLLGAAAMHRGSRPASRRSPEFG